MGMVSQMGSSNLSLEPGLEMYGRPMHLFIFVSWLGERSLCPGCGTSEIRADILPSRRTYLEAS
jgi:hypothetical protein